jgi:hypothetical protein
MNNSVQVHWQKIKFKHLGKQGVSELDYNFINGRFDPARVFDNTNWLKTTPIEIDFWDQPLNTGQIRPNEDYYEQGSGTIYHFKTSSPISEISLLNRKVDTLYYQDEKVGRFWNREGENG